MVEIRQKLMDKTLEDTIKTILELYNKAKKIRMKVKSIAFYDNHVLIKMRLDEAITEPELEISLSTYEERGDKIDMEITLRLDKMKDEYRELVDYILYLDK